MSIGALYFTGIARIGHFGRTPAGETAPPRSLGLHRSPSGDTPYDLRGRVTARHVEQPGRIHRTYLDEQAHFEQGSVVADLDLSVRSTEWRTRRGATPGHDPEHEGRDCYQWAVAFAPGVVVWQQLCRGCTSGHGLVRPALEALRRSMPHLAVLWLDGGSLSAKELNSPVSEHVGFLTEAGAKLRSVRTLLEWTGPEQWQSYDENTRPCRRHRVQLLDDSRTPVTAVLVECRRRIKAQKKGRVCWKTRTFRYAIATDQHHGTTAKIHETYKERRAVENFFEESNQSFGSGERPSGQFRGNQPFLALLVVVDHPMQSFKRDCLPRVDQAVSPATVRRHFLEHAVVIEERSEMEIHPVFNEDYPQRRGANIMMRKVYSARLNLARVVVV